METVAKFGDRGEIWRPWRNLETVEKFGDVNRRRRLKRSVCPGTHYIGPITIDREVGGREGGGANIAEGGEQCGGVSAVSQKP